MQTYKKATGEIIVRSCINCKQFDQLKYKDREGYCRARPMYFAYTLERGVYPIVKTYYLCDSHCFINENEYKGLEMVELKDVIKKKTK